MLLVADAPKKVMKRRFLGEILVDAGLLDQDFLDSALTISKAEGKKLGRVLMDMGKIKGIDIANALSDQLKMPLIRFDRDFKIDPDVLPLIPRELINNYQVLPYQLNNGVLSTITSNPLDMRALDDIRFSTGLNVEFMVAAEQDIVDAIEAFFPAQGLIKSAGNQFESISMAEQGSANGLAGNGSSSSINSVLNSVGKDSDEISFTPQKKQEDDTMDASADMAEQPPIIRFVNAIFSDAITQKASDIHIEPHRHHVIVRFRVDGVMREVMKVERNIHASIVSRIKVLSKMDISQRRVPQDGKLKITFKSNNYDLRVSTLPTAYGEKVTIRVLSSVGGPPSIDHLSISEHGLKLLRYAIEQPQGLVLVTGPTGSGKTTTLYTCLKSLMSPEVNIVTLENPVEYELDGINQVEINTKAGLTFASGLRSILRQDPDIVLLGEIRDKETAEIAFHAAQTGHLVLSTLHTNSAILSVSRLLDLGIDAFTVGSSLNAVVGQRLVRRLCDVCKTEDTIGAEIFERLPEALKKQENLVFYKAVGCKHCNSTGYTGRVGIHEVLAITPSFEQKISEGVSIYELEKTAIRNGFNTLHMDGMFKAAEGLTSLSEVYRVAPPPLRDYIEPEEESKEPSPSAEAAEALVLDDIDPVTTLAARKVLVVSADEFMVRIIQGIVEGEGYHVLSARNGAEALRIAMHEKPDLVITEYAMPEMDGMHLIRELKSRLATAYIPLIMITEAGKPELEIEGINMGADDSMTKPFNERLLIARVNRLIKRQG
jgi:type IV pilus assembly protein PilB